MKDCFNNPTCKRFVSIALFTFLASFSSFGQTDAKTILDRLFANPEYKNECVVITQMRHNNVDEKKILDFLETNYAKPHKQHTTTEGTHKNINPGLNSTLCIGAEMGAELGNFGTWKGEISAWSTYTSCPTAPWSPTALPVPGRITLVSTPSSDPCADVVGSPIQLPSPTGGKFSIKLGNNNINSESERITHSFLVQPGDTNFVYQYAVVLEDKGHLPSEQPFFDFILLDKNKDTIPCSFRHYVAGGSIPGFIKSNLTNSNCNNLSNLPTDTYYKPWTTVGVNLKAYVGDSVTAICTTADCSRCGHMGYTYLDFSCGGLAPVYYCPGTTSVVVTAPTETGASYFWSTGQTTSSIIVNPQVDDSVLVNVSMPSGCGYHILYVLIPNIITPGLGFTNVCNNYFFVDTSKTVSGTISGWNWNFGDGSTSTSQNAGHVYTQAGTFTVTLVVTSQLGCKDTMQSIPITIAPPPVANAGPDVSICPGGQTTLSASATPSGGTYTWDPDPTLSNTTISNPVAIPSVTSAYHLTYHDLSGCTNYDHVNVIVYTPVKPTVGSPLSICIGNSTTLSVANGSNYVWSPSTGLNNPNITNPTANPSSTTNYTVTVNDVHGCVASSTELVTVIQLPVVNAGTNQTICSNKQANLNANSNPGGVSFNWLPTSGLSNPNISNPIFTPSASGLFTFTVSISAASGCSNKGAVSIFVNPIPAVVASNSVAICPGSSTTLTASSGTAINYTWSPSSTLNNATIPNPVATPLNPGTLTYTVTVSDANGCTNSDYVNVVVYTPVKPTVGPSLSICAGKSTTLSAASGSNFVWSPSSSLNNPAISTPIASPTASTTYTVTVDDLHGCTASSTELVTVIQLPVVNAGSDQIICSDKSGNLNANSNPAGITYNWSPSTGLSSSTISNPKFTPPASGTYTFTVIISSTFGCSNSDAVIISVNPLPVVNATNSVVICAGNSTMLTASSGTATNYVWSPSTYLSNANISNPVATPPLPGTYVYNVTVSDTNLCTKSAITTVNVTAKPVADASYVKSLRCEGMAYEFKDSSQFATSWNWDFGDGSTSSLQNPPIHIYEYNGIHTVTLIVSNGACVDTFKIPVVVGDLNTFINVKPANVFTPNSDGKNDCFKPIIGSPGSGADADILAQCMTMEVFDRWGIKIYEVDGGSNICWDGTTISNTKAKEGTYYYVITLGGNKFKGYVTLLREKR